MSQYRISMYLAYQIGMSLRYENETLSITLPFINIYIALTKEASGYDIFNIWTK